MNEEYKSPWQIEHDKMLKQQEAEKRAQEKKTRARFLRGLKLTRKSDRNLDHLLKDEQAKILEKTAKAANKKQEEEKEDSIVISSFVSIAPVFKKIWLVFFIFALLFSVSIYTLSPISRVGSFIVEGNNIVNSSDIAEASKLKMRDSIFSVFMNRKKIEKSIADSSPRIEKTSLNVSLPNKITITVHEFKAIGYVEQNGKIYAILANGTRLSEKVIAANAIAPESIVLKNFSDQQVEKFSKAFETLEPSLQSMIRTVTITPSQATKDFITFQMSDGNQVKVPLSQMKEKLPYYPNVAKNLKAPMTVDMEVGIFSAPTPNYDKDFAGNVPESTTPSSSPASSSSSKAQ